MAIAVARYLLLRSGDGIAVGPCAVWQMRTVPEAYFGRADVLAREKAVAKEATSSRRSLGDAPAGLGSDSDMQESRPVQPS